MAEQNKPAKAQPQNLSVAQLLETKSIKTRLTTILGEKKANAFSSALVQISQSSNLAKCKPATILNAAVTAAVLDLPINPVLGFAWIVPYKDSAQFQMGWKGYIQLAQRTGQYKRINAIAVYENQLKSYDFLSEKLDANFKIEGKGKVIGYIGYFELLNGFEKTVYWPKDKMAAHAKKYSKTFNSETSVWKSHFDEMAMKTLVKHMISRWGVASLEQAQAILADQSVQDSEGQYQYPDNDGEDFAAYDELESSTNSPADKTDKPAADEKPMV